MKLFNLFILLILVIAPACSSKPISTPEQTFPSPTLAAYPMVGEEGSGDLHPAIGNLAPTWTPDAQLSQVIGRLLLRGKPVADLNLYLGGTIKDSQGLEFAASLNRLQDPTALTDKDGNFHFMNVPPGRYVLIIDNVTSVSLLMDPTGNQAILLTLEPGDKKDLGVLDYTDLPIALP